MLFWVEKVVVWDDLFDLLAKAVAQTQMLTLAGIPLTADFIGKFYIIATGVESHQWWLVGSLVLGIGVFYYLRVMVNLYLIEPNLCRHDAQLHWEQKAGGAMLLAIALVALFLGVYPQPLLTLVQQSGLAGWSLKRYSATNRNGTFGCRFCVFWTYYCPTLLSPPTNHSN